MICWQLLLKRALPAALALTAIAVRPEPASAAPGVGVIAGAGAHIVPSGVAVSLVGAVDVMGWGGTAHYWSQTGTGANWLSAGLRRNISPIPMVSIAPGVGVAMWRAGTVNATGPMGMLTAGFYPLMMPFAVDASVGAAWLNGSMALPYSLGVKLSLIPFTALVARWRGWEGSAGINASGPEIGAEVGF